MDTHPTWQLRELGEAELDALYETRIESDFPKMERPSLSAMRRHMRKNLQDIWMLNDGKDDVAYAVCASANGIMLVTLLAVFDEFRGGGIGTALLALLKEQYAGSRAIILEVEDPAHAADADDLLIREKRIAFYERSGYTILPEVEHISFGIPFLLMALPLQASLDEIRAGVVPDVLEIYHKILPEEHWPQVQTRTR